MTLDILDKNLPPPLTERQRSLAALLRSWLEEGATDNPEEIRRAEEELAEFKRQMNANRYPEESLYL